MTNIENPEALLKAHEQAKADLVALRETLKELEADMQGVKDERDKFESEIANFKADGLKGKILEALKAQNVKNPDSLVKYVDLDGIGEDENGKLTGLDDAIKTVKADFPERFVARKAAAGTSVDAHASNPPAKEAKSGTEAQIAKIFSKN